MQELRRKGIGLAVISYDPPATLAAFSKQRGITYPLLSDQGSKTITRYGILNPLPALAQGPGKDDPALVAEVRKYVAGGGVAAPMMVGIALPGTFMLDTRGRVTSRFFEDFYVDRNTVSSVMIRAGVGSAPVAATKISSGQLDVTMYATDTALAPGNHISLVFEVTPKKGMHVYAPGASSYRIIGVTLAPQPFVELKPMIYPASERYTFKPLNETTPVFMKPFRLIQELHLLGTSEAQAALRGKTSLTVSGTLDYQACDDKVCYNPSSVPVSWTFDLRSLVTERPPVLR